MSKNRKAKKKSNILIVIVFLLGFFSGNFITANFLLTGEEVIHINIVYSSEKASWMSIAYSNFIEDWNEKNPNKKITIEMQPYGSSDSIISILNGEIFPTIWSPASSIWIPILNSKWMQYTKTDIPLADINNATKIIYSPIVIATWAEFNRTHEINGFKDLHELGLNPNVGLRMAHTDPRLSNSGLMSTIMALSAASGIASDNFTMDVLTDPDNQEWLKEFESTAVMYGKSTGFLAKYMKSGGPNALHVAFLYENLIRDISSTAEGGKIIAIYPEEGTLYSNHPFCILNADWITEDQREVANAFIAFLNKKETVESALQYGFRPINAAIPIDPDVFNYQTNGIAYDIKVPELNTPNDGDVLLKIPDLWSLCKATG